MDIIIRIRNVKNNAKEINEVIQKLKGIQGIYEFGGGLKANSIE